MRVTGILDRLRGFWPHVRRLALGIVTLVVAWAAFEAFFWLFMLEGTLYLILVVAAGATAYLVGLLFE